MGREDFEKKLMEMLLAGEDSVLIQLRKQYELAKVISRDYTDVGFFTTFSLKDKQDLCIEDKSFQIGDVDGTVNGIKGAIGFILYIKNGVISLLEGYTNVIDKWPEYDNQIILTYDSGDKRDFLSLKNKWI